MCAHEYGVCAAEPWSRGPTVPRDEQRSLWPTPDC